MDTWVDHVYQQLLNIAAKDTDYQDILEQCVSREERYLQIVSQLPDEERLAVDDYVATCEELVFRFAQLAYQLGFLKGSVT